MQIQIEAKVFKAALKVASLFASKDETRPFIAATHLRLANNALVITSTDGHTLQRTTLHLRAQEGEAEATIDNDGLERLIKALPRSKGLIEFVIEIEDGEIRYNLAPALNPVKDYPKYNRAIPPRDNTITGPGPFGIDPHYLARIGKACSLLFGTATGGIRVQCADPSKAIRFDRASLDPDVEFMAVVMPFAL